MPARHIRPLDIEKFFNEKLIPYEDTNDFWDTMKKAAFKLGFSVNVTSTDKIRVKGPAGNLSVYTDMGINKKNISIALYHATMTQKMHH